VREGEIKSSLEQPKNTLKRLENKTQGESSDVKITQKISNMTQVILSGEQEQINKPAGTERLQLEKKDVCWPCSLSVSPATSFFFIARLLTSYRII